MLKAGAGSCRGVIVACRLDRCSAGERDAFTVSGRLTRGAGRWPVLRVDAHESGGLTVTYNRTVHAGYDALLADLLDACRRHYSGRLVAVAVYGSVGRGTPRFDSDIDVLIVANGLPAGWFPRVDDFRAVEQALASRLEAAREASLHPELSPIFRTPAALVRGTPLLLDMTEDARILHDLEGCLASVLDGLRARLKQLGSRRIWRGNAWYWDPKARLQVGRRHRAEVF